MAKSRMILFAAIFLLATAFFLLTPKQPTAEQNFNFYNLPILIAVLIWVVWKVLALLKKRRKN